MNKKDDLEKLFDQVFGQKIRVQRKKLNLTQTAAAEKCDNYRQWIGDLENGNSTPGLYTLYRYTQNNGIDLTAAIQETFEEFTRKSKPIQIVADQKKLQDYINRTRNKKKRHDQGHK